MKNLRFLKYVFGITVLPYLLLCFFNQPSYDDFSYAVSTFGRTFWQAQVQWYSNWSGRFTATALLTILNPLEYHWIYGYKLVSLAVIVGLWAVVRFLVNTFFGQLTSSERRLVTSFLVAAYLSLLPYLSGGIYWMAGSLTHAVPTLLAGLGVALIRRRGRSNWSDYFVLPLITLLIVGSNETIMCIWMALLLLANLYAFYSHRKIDPVLVLLLMTGIAGSLIVIAAPGNAVRGSGFPKAHRLLHSVTESTAYAFAYAVKFASVPFGLVLLWAAKHARMIQEKLRWDWINKKSLALTSAVLFLVQFCTFFPAEWAMGGRPPKYVYNMSEFFYVPLSVLMIIQIAIVYPDRVRFLDRFNFDSKKMIFAFCILFIALGNNGRAIYDLVWEGPRYNAEINERYEKMAQSRGRDIVFGQLLYRPKSIFYSDLDADPTTFKNRQYARYFDLKSARTAKGF